MNISPCAAPYHHYFELFTSFLEWVVLYETGSRSFIHYLDDFVFIALQGREYTFLLDTFHLLMTRFRVPLSTKQTWTGGGPVTTISFLDIEIDWMDMVFHLPKEKLSRLLDLVNGFCSVSKVT